MGSLREQLARENEIIKMQAERTATNGSIIVEENYTLQDLEEYVVNKIHEGKLRFLKMNFNKIVKLILKTEDNCYDTTISEERLFLTMYLNYYFNNIEPYIFHNKISEFFSYDDLILLCADNKEFVLPKSTGGLICRKEDEEALCCKYKNSIEDEKTLEIIAVKLFEKPIKAIKSFLVGKQITSLQPSLSVSLSMYSEANRINKYKQIRSLVKDELGNIASEYKLTNIILIPTDSDPILILTRANFMCILSVDSIEGYLSISKYEKYVVFSKYDTLTQKMEDGTTVSMDATISPVYTKKTSVVGSALVGTAVAGVAGGYVGTLLAEDANRKRQEQINSYKPLIVDIKLPTLHILFELKKVNSYYSLYVSKALCEDKEIEQFLSIISETKTDRACFEGELIKEFILDSDSKEGYSEEKFTRYKEQKKEKLRKEVLKNDNRLAVIIDKEVENQKSIKDSESKCGPMSRFSTS